MSFIESRARAIAYIGLLLLLLTLTSAQVQNYTVCFDIITVNRLYKQIASLSKASGEPAWPPSDVSSFRDGNTNQYNLGLHLMVLPQGDTFDWTYIWLTKLHNYYQIKRPLEGSPFRKLVIMQEALGPEVTNKTEYDFYPPILPVKTEVNKVKSGYPVDFPPIDDPNIELIRYPKTCQPETSDKYDLVVVIASCVKCYNYRYWARRTFMQPKLWPSFKVGFVFLVGVPATENIRVFDFYGTKIKQEPSYAGQANRGEATKMLLQEADQYHDLLIGNFEDEFFNSTLRCIMGFRWAAFFCGHRTPLFLFLDPESGILPSNVITFVRSIPEKVKPVFYGGYVFRDNPVLRTPGTEVTDNRWAVSENEIPWSRYLPYVSRTALFVGNQAVVDATIAMGFTRRFRILDVYLGIVFYRLQYAPVHLPQIAHSVNKCNVESVLAGPMANIGPLIDWSTGQLK